MCARVCPGQGGDVEALLWAFLLARVVAVWPKAS